MNTATRTKLLESLTNVIDTWLDDAWESLLFGEGCELPWLADSTPESMAQAAITVLGAIADAQNQAVTDGWLQDVEL